MRLTFITLPLLALCAVVSLLACKPDCREKVRMADFEASQNNHARAEKLYAEALKIDATACADAESKREQVLRFMGR